MEQLELTPIPGIIADTGLSEEHVEEILNCCRGHRNAVEMRPFVNLRQIQDERREGFLSTGSDVFDDILGGGMPFNRITEITGQPGSGKTQFCLFTCLQVALPKTHGGLEREIVYIDTEGGVSASRLVEMLHYMFEGSSDKPNMDAVLARIRYLRVHGFEELEIAISAAERRLDELNGQCRLLIIDSIAAPLFYRSERKAAQMTKLGQLLRRIALEYCIVVLTTNQLTRKYSSESSTKDDYNVALGDAWSHFVCNRLLLKQANASRFVRLTKSSHNLSKEDTFEITLEGITSGL
jgi:RecA/RadA recombinase